MYDVTKTYLDTHEAQLTVIFDDKTVQDEMRIAARGISRKTNIPGFRKGKAPYAIVLRYFGEEAILQEATEKMLDKFYPEIVDQVEVEPYGPGRLEDVQVNPLTFKIRVPMQPTVELGDYRSLRLPWAEPEVTEEELSAALEQVRDEHVVLEPAERAAQLDDEVYVDVIGLLDDEELINEENAQVVLTEERIFITPGFIEELVGMQAGDERTFTLALSEEEEEPELRGAMVSFTVKMRDVFERVLPELDDALASTAGNFETLEELELDLSRRILEHKSGHAKDDYSNALVQALIAQADVHYPPMMLEEEIEDMIKQTDEHFQHEHKISLEDALRLQGQTMEQHRATLQPHADQRLKRLLVLTKFAQQEAIDVNDDEVVLEYSNLFNTVGLPDELKSQRLDLNSQLGQALRVSLHTRKVMERLMQIGRGEIAEVVEEDAKADDATQAIEDTELGTVQPAMGVSDESPAPDVEPEEAAES
ncbi:MAG: trigger factor [Anaerolineae bacterium]|nr:trigger factor [Anaerolineae bacterium]